MLVILVRALNKDIRDTIPLSVLVLTLAFSTTILVVSVAAYTLTRTPNLVAAIAASIITYSNASFAMFAKFNKLREKYVLCAASSVIILTLSVGLIFWKIHYLLSKNFPAEIKEPGYATLLLIFIIAISYVANRTVEKATPSLYWRIGRFLGEDFITIVYVSAFGVLGPAIAFFGVSSLDSPLSLITLLLALIPVPAKLKNMQMLARREKIKTTIEDTIKNLLARIPVVKKIAEMRVYSLGPLASVDLNLVTSELVRDRLDALGDAIKVPIVDGLGNIVSIRISITTTTDLEILIGIPIEDSKICDGICEKYLTLRVDLKTLEFRDSRVEMLDLSEEDKILEEIVSKKLDVFCLKRIDRKIKNYLHGYFILPLQLQSETIENAKSEVIESLRKILLPY